MTFAKINIKRLRENANKIRHFAPLIAVVKADAYGHGAVTVAKSIEDIAASFAVATADEATELIKCGIKKDVLILGKSDCVLPYGNIVYSVSSVAELKKLSMQRPIKAAIKVNSGMNRFGVNPPEFADLIKFAYCCAQVDSVYSHLRDTFSVDIANEQLYKFKKITDNINCNKHLAASGGIALGGAFYFDRLRCGLALYGGQSGYKQVMTVYSNVILVRTVRAGEGCGYGCGIFDCDKTIAVIDVGYADGYRRLSAKRKVFINDKYYDVVAVCMDVSFVCVDNSVSAGDKAELTGEHISASDLAASYGTINYEVFTGVGKRIARIYE